MKKITTELFIAACMLVPITGCSRIAPDAGHEAVLIEKPMFFGHGGVDDTPVTSGSTFVALTTNAEYVSMQPIQVAEHFDDLMSSDGVPLDFDAVIRLQVTNSVKLIKTFGTNWYPANVAAELRNRVRQAVRKHGMNETAINSKAIDEIDAEISSAMEKYILEAGLPLKLIQITVGKANPPDSIKNQRVETAAQQQRALTEGQRKLAEDSRLAAELSRANADNAYRNAMQLSPDQFLKLETIKMQQTVCTSSKAACSFLIGTSATPIIDTRR